MGFSSFRLNVLWRVLIVLALCLSVAWGWLAMKWLVTPVVCAALLALATVGLIRYLERTARELTGFLNFIASHDFSVAVSTPHKEGVFKGLEQAYRILTGEFRRLNLEKASDHRYLEAVVEHAGVALVCFEGEVVIMLNDRARRLFGVPHLVSLKSFDRIDARLPELLRQLGHDERSLISVSRGEDRLQLVLYATTFDLLGRHFKLVSFHNIRDELDRRETDSWQKLIRVLTHEIMNSVTPIISLSQLVRDTMMDDGGGTSAFRAPTPQAQDDMLRSVTAIHARSLALLEFVQAYRNFARLPDPVLGNVDVPALFERVATLMAPDLAAHHIALESHCEPQGLAVQADAQQVEQALINLLRNAAEALAGRPSPRIELRGMRDEAGCVLLQVSDNGPGIDPAHLENIFVPFFTTKRHGSGVGLSITRQIMQAHSGFVTVRSPPGGGGSSFTLRFR
jgi:two-component system, NtrC family, nitrogen regulation sensor histidine kinase NtrY